MEITESSQVLFSASPPSPPGSRFSSPTVSMASSPTSRVSTSTSPSKMMPSEILPSSLLKTLSLNSDIKAVDVVVAVEDDDVVGVSFLCALLMCFRRLVFVPDT